MENGAPYKYPNNQNEFTDVPLGKNVLNISKFTNLEIIITKNDLTLSQYLFL
jgi:hypothetical protein